MGGGETKLASSPICVEPEEFKRTWARTTKLKWTHEGENNLRESIMQSRFNRHGKTIKPKILVFGPSGCGKSTLCNGFVSALEGERDVSSYFAVCSMTGSFTKGFRPRKTSDLWIIDMVGVFESKAIKDSDIKDIASGKIPFYAKLSQHLEVRDRDKLPVPEKNDVACVVLVFSLGMEIPPEIKRMLRCIMDLAGEGVVTYRVVLTHADICDKKFMETENLPEIFDSPVIQNGVMSIAEQTGIPPTAISVVRNYANEPETDLFSNLLLLHALDKVVHAAYEQVQKKDNRELMMEMYNDSD